MVPFKQIGAGSQITLNRAKFPQNHRVLQNINC